MKKYREFIGKYYESIHGACLCTGLLLLADSFWVLHWPALLLSAGAVLFSLLLHYAVQKNIVIPAGCILLILHVILLIFFFMTGRDLYTILPYIQMEAACIGGSVLCLFAVRHLFLTFPILLSEITCLFYYGAVGVPLSKWNICLIFFCCLLFLAEAAGKKRGIGKQEVFFLSPLFLACLILICLLPVKNTPIRWETVRKAAGAVQEKANALLVNLDYLFSGASNIYALSETGYGSEGALGGSLIRSDKPQISVTGTMTKSPLYLAGTIYDTYDGTSWKPEEPTGQERGKEYQEQYRTINEALSVSGLTDTEIRSLTHVCSIEIKFEGLKTQSLFHAPNTWKFQLPSSLKPEAHGGNLLLPKPKGVGFVYGLQYVELNYKSENFQKLLAVRGDFDRDNTRRSRIFEDCTLLPEDLPPRVYELADEITRDCETPYEELEAIRTYLLGYSYSTTTEVLEEGRDFADCFLFDTKSGYCTSFATAMAVLGRCRGIPTRYVEGFATDQTCSVEDTEIHLGGSSAHAWAEAYLEPVGWIPFDSTPGYSANTASPWEDETSKDSSLPAPADSENSSPHMETEDNGNTASVRDTETEKPFYKSFLLILLKLLPLLLLLTAACILAGAVLLFRKFMQRRAYAAMDSYGKMLFLMDKLFLLGRLSGIPFEDGETLLQYEEKAAGTLDVPGTALTEIFRMFREIRYGGRESGPETILYLNNYIHALEIQYLQGCSRTKRLLYRLK